jgi:DNA-binding transcriptional regulator YiaG
LGISLHPHHHNQGESMTPENFKHRRQKLGLSQAATARLMQMGKRGAQNVHRWEVGHSPLPGWATVIMEIVSSGTIPNLDQVKNPAEVGQPPK